MNEQEILSGLQDILQDVLDDPTFQVTPETNAKDHPEWDSFNHINIVVGIEMRFSVKFNALELDGLKNVGDFVSLIQRKKQAAAA
jgi:acyl carrier protein